MFGLAIYSMYVDTYYSVYNANTLFIILQIYVQLQFDKLVVAIYDCIHIRGLLFDIKNRKK